MLRSFALVWAIALAGCGSSPAAAVAESPVDDEAADDDRGFWIEQPRASDIDADASALQTVLEVALDPSLAPSARVELWLDEQLLWEGAYREPLHVALPAGDHRLALAVVSPGGTGRAQATFASSRGCRVRISASGAGPGVRLGQRVHCGSAASR